MATVIAAAGWGSLDRLATLLTGTPYAALVGEVRLSAEQVSVVAAWSVAGPESVPVTIVDAPVAYTAAWEDGDVLVTQGDSHIQVNRRGQIEESAPALAADLG